jgi:hypothetical protein
MFFAVSSLTIRTVLRTDIAIDRGAAVGVIFVRFTAREQA